MDEFLCEHLRIQNLRWYYTPAANKLMQMSVNETRSEFGKFIWDELAGKPKLCSSPKQQHIDINTIAVCLFFVLPVNSGGGQDRR